MRILLFNPPFYRFIGLEQDYVPLSLLAVGSELIKEGHEVFIKNMEVGVKQYAGYNDRTKNFSHYINGVENESKIWDEVRNTIADILPNKIGITVMSVKLKSALRIIQIANEFKIKCFVGGPHSNIGINDFPNDIEIIPGEFESRDTKKRIKNLDSLPMPEWSMLLDLYSPNGYSHLTSSRGCPYSCRFCASSTIWNKKVTFKSAERIIAEMRDIKKRFNSTEFTFWDETFTGNRSRLKKFCNLYNINATWNCDTRADVLDNETILLMKNSGCKHMSIGIESGCNHILRYIGKRETIDTFIRTADLLKKHEIQWKAYCIIGFPEETVDDIRRSIEFIKSLNPFRITLSFFTPYKNTPLYKECIEKGIIDKKTYDPSEFAHQSPNNYFCRKITHDEYNNIREWASKEIDEYNKNALLTWK